MESKIWLTPPPLLPTPFDPGTPKTIRILLSLYSIILVSYNVLSLMVLPSERGKLNMLEASPPLFPPFDLGTPKTIGALLGLCSIILVSCNVLSPTVLSLANGQQNMVKSPPLPPF